MQFIKKGDQLTAIRITGPTSNLLVLEITNDRVNAIAIESLPRDGTINIHDEKALEELVITGVRDANNELGTDYRVAKIRFVPTDSLPLDTYRMMANAIVHRYHFHPQDFDITT